MPAKKKNVITISIDDDLTQRIEDFRFENRILSRSETFRILLEKGLEKAVKRPQGKKTPS